MKLSMEFSHQEKVQPYREILTRFSLAREILVSRREIGR